MVAPLVLHQHQELVAARPRQHCTRTFNAPQSLGHSHQKLITHMVPADVVQDGEVVQVDQEQHAAHVQGYCTVETCCSYNSISARL